MKVKFIRMILGVDASEASTPERIERAARAAAAELGTSLFFVETGASESPSGSPSGGGSASYGVQLIVAPHGVRSGRSPQVRSSTSRGARKASLRFSRRRRCGCSIAISCVRATTRRLMRASSPRGFISLQERRSTSWPRSTIATKAGGCSSVCSKREGRRARGFGSPTQGISSGFMTDFGSTRINAVRFAWAPRSTGLWKHLSVVMPLTPADFERLFDFLFRIQDIGQRLRELDDFLKDH